MHARLTPDRRLPPTARLWKLMQLVETCRHHADRLDEAAQCAGRRHGEELAAIARQWRSCAVHIQLLEATSEAPCAPRPAAPTWFPGN